jgi:hypothetical protein
MTKSALISHVRVALNDMQPFDEATIAESGNMPAKPVEAYAEKSVGPALESILLAGPVRLLNTTELTLNTSNMNAVSVGSKKYAVVTLPIDYLRFASMTLSTWMRPVEALGSERGRARQYFEYTMTTERNPCVYEDRNRLQVTLEAFPYSGSTSGANKLYYVPRYDGLLSDTRGTDSYVRHELDEALVYAVAMRVMVYFGKDPSAMAALYKNAAEIAEAGAKNP